MTNLDPATKLKLESLLKMSGGYVLDFTNESFADFVRTSLGFDPYDKYPKESSKARLLRKLWAEESPASVAKLNLDLLEYWRVNLRIANKTAPETHEAMRRELVDRFHSQDPVPVSITTEATVRNNKIEIVIHPDLYGHIGQYLVTGDYFHAVEESYKLVRGKLREITGSEKATDAFAADNIESIFGHKAANQAEDDFFTGVKFLNMSIQFLRNEKAHTTARPVERNLALHYISVASLAYDLITRYVSEQVISEIEELVASKRRSFASASAFYRAFDGGKWIQTMAFPSDLKSSAVLDTLKRKWLDEADFTRSWDHSNVVLMRLELVAEKLTALEIEGLLDLPTVDDYGNDQMAGLSMFLAYMQGSFPDKITPRVADEMAKDD